MTDTSVHKAISKRILKTTNKRSSSEAAETLSQALEDLGKELAQDASDYAKHAGRKTIQEEDVRAALRDL